MNLIRLILFTAFIPGLVVGYIPYIIGTSQKEKSKLS
jgi:K+-transporting ATPase A subunit